MSTFTRTGMVGGAVALFALAAPPLFAQATPPADSRSGGEPAQQMDFTVTAGGTSSNNIERVAQGEESGLIGVTGVVLDYTQHTRRIDADVDLNTAYQHFFDGEFDDDVVGGVNAKLNLGIVPDRFTWGFTENFGQIDFDPFAASTPDNRENVNIFGTSPALLFRFGDVVNMKISARYSQSSYERSTLDGKETGGQLELAHDLSGKSSVSFVATGTRYDFDDQVLNTNYDLGEALVRYSLEGSRTTLDADVGYNSVRIDKTSGGTLLRLSLSRRIFAGAEFKVGAGREISSAGDVFRLGQGTGGVQLGSINVIGTGDPFERSYVNVGYHFQKNRTSLGIDAESTRERYETQTQLDRDVTNYSGFLTRQLSPVLSVRLFVTFQHEVYDNINFDDDELDLGAHVDWQVGANLALRLRYDHFDRNSSRPTSVYSEDQASLFVMWSPIRQR